MHRTLAINRWHLLHFAALSFFAARVLRLAVFSSFFSFPPPPPLGPFFSRVAGRKGKAEEASATGVYTCAHTYLRINTSERNEFVRLGTRITCFTCRTGTPWEVRSSFRVTPAPRVSNVSERAERDRFVERNVWIFPPSPTAQLVI